MRLVGNLAISVKVDCGGSFLSVGVRKQGHAFWIVWSTSQRLLHNDAHLGRLDRSLRYKYMELYVLFILVISYTRPPWAGWLNCSEWLCNTAFRRKNEEDIPHSAHHILVLQLHATHNWALSLDLGKHLEKGRREFIKLIQDQNLPAACQPWSASVILWSTAVFGLVSQTLYRKSKVSFRYPG